MLKRIKSKKRPLYFEFGSYLGPIGWVLLFTTVFFATLYFLEIQKVEAILYTVRSFNFSSYSDKMALVNLLK